MKKYVTLFSLSLALLAGCDNLEQNTSTENISEETSTSENASEQSFGSAASAVTVDFDALDPNSIENEPAYNTPISVGFTGQMCNSAGTIAHELGYFAEQDLEIEMTNIEHSNGIDALATGKLDLYNTHVSSYVVPIVNGVNATLITPAQTGCKSLYVLEDSGIESTAELEGQSIAVPNGIGASDHNIALRFLNRDGVDTESVTYKPVETSAAVQSLESGEIQGVILDDQFAYDFVENGTLKSIRSLTSDDDFGSEPCCAFALNTDFINENPLTSQRIAKAIIKARYWMQENPDEAVTILDEQDQISGDIDVATEIFKSYNWTVTNEEAKEGFENITNEYKELGLVETEESTDSIVERNYNSLGITDEDIQEVIDGGF